MERIAADYDRSRVMVALRQMVAEGTAIPAERRLSDQLGANRYVVRQVIQTLRGEGVLAAPRRARPPIWQHESIVEHTSPPDLWELRLMLEPKLARLAVLNGTPRELSLIVDIHSQCEPLKFDRALDVAFHRAIANASHNRLAAFLIDRLSEITMDPGFQIRSPQLTRETGFDHHEAIVQAIRARMPVESEMGMAIHLRAITNWARGRTPVDL